MLWSLRNQPARVFNWTDILSDWKYGDSDPNPPVQVSTLLENLARPQSPPAGHFLQYLNEEQDGLKWFIFECVASSWMWGSGPRLLYIREAVDLLESLESTFPEFPGSPTTQKTVREFLTDTLTEDQLAYIQMLPLLVPLHVQQQQQQQQPNGPTIRFLIIRNKNTENDDDSVTIRKVGDNSYSYVYMDAHSVSRKKSVVHNNLNGDQVLQMLRTLFNLLVLDTEPFSAVQVFLPSTPTVMLDVESLTSSTRDLMYDSVDLVLKSWPSHA